MINKISDFREEYQKLSEREIELFELLVNKLINVNYLTVEKEEEKANYYFIISHLDCFKIYFEIGGMELTHYQASKTLVLRGEHFTKLSLTKINSIIVLIIRLLYHQKLHDTSLMREILITTRELQEKYEQLNINGEERIKKSDLEETLRILKKHNIVNYKGQDFFNDDFVITIYSTIKYAVEIDTLEALNEKINSYRGGSIEDEEITED